MEKLSTFIFEEKAATYVWRDKRRREGVKPKVKQCLQTLKKYRDKHSRNTKTDTQEIQRQTLEKYKDRHEYQAGHQIWHTVTSE